MKKNNYYLIFIFFLIVSALINFHCNEVYSRNIIVDNKRDYSSDSNIGTEDSPLKTINYAASIAVPGDVVIVHEGVYRETVNLKKSGGQSMPIIFRASEGDKVIISGCDLVKNSWEKYSNDIYQTTLNDKIEQIFVDGKMMVEARWPNIDPNDIMSKSFGVSELGTDQCKLYLSNNCNGELVGANIQIWPGAGWYTSTRKIEQCIDGKSVIFDDCYPLVGSNYHDSTAYIPRPGNNYIIYGALELLDSPGEWYYDSNLNLIYLWTLNDDNPSVHEIEFKKRNYAFIGSGVNYIQIDGFEIFASSINLNNSSNNLIKNCKLRYVNHERLFPVNNVTSSDMLLSGNSNVVEDCSFGYSGTSLLKLRGTDNKILNSIFFDGNYLGSYLGVIDINDSVGTEISHCRIVRGGRDLIQMHNAKKAKIIYNDLSRGNIFNNDSGAIYAWGTDGEGSIIGWNWIHHNLGMNTVGVYLDNFCKNFVINNNYISYNSLAAIALNSSSLNNKIVNNTIIRNKNHFSVFTYSGYEPSQSGVVIANNIIDGYLNLTNESVFVQGVLGPYISNNESCPLGKDGVPVGNSCAIDNGIVVPGVNDSFYGEAPDIGAYEHGVDAWIAGPVWKEVDEPMTERINLAFAPMQDITEETMITDGLILWLNANKSQNFIFNNEGYIDKWLDSSGGNAIIYGDVNSLQLVESVNNKMNAVKFSGKSMLKIFDLMEWLGPISVFIVSEASDIANDTWQRLASSWKGDGDDWISPNWIILRPGDGDSILYKPTLLKVKFEQNKGLSNLCIGGTAARESQKFSGNIQEIIIYNRILGIEEEYRITQYLKSKWKLSPAPAVYSIKAQ
nr:right-handed parallel beta-helix repeat-containing protein [uncultured Desulfobulbus sp.]